MKAIVYDKKNKTDFLVMREVEKPIVKADHVLVKIHNVSLNAADYRSLKMGIVPDGRIMGADIAGVIEEVGGNVKKFKIGDSVFGDLSGCGFGGLAEYVAAPESVLASIPPSVSFETASALPMASVTALQAMRNLGNLQSGQNVLICGAGGGVGTFAVQLAKHFNANVTAVCGRNNVETIKSLGADTVIDYSQEDFAKSTKRYDLVLVLNGNRSISSYRKVMSPKSICVMSGGSLSQLLKFTILGPLLSIGGKKMRLLSAKPDTSDLAFIMRLVEEGKVRPVIDKRYRLDETLMAMRYLNEGHAKGKVVIGI
ncbi:MAG: alcohol dehydrogenase [Firmicutes bacterium GWF2_51_9]|nr:MAG: alcohol dehydrogenase [Firmicutes bacterium GWF2_51_9]OGS57430.1 MAG: alcohol dehydrogenase [Firmicutes bacterium GWE2_51_13]HAM63172.1 alcohol dehydrogenase [Erysipelotrichaceae bacterium]HBZ41551.1 alcohol dehydrogenase [Erysipelotrichaceae bacterium]